MTKIGVLSDTHIHDLRTGIDFLQEIRDRHFQDVSCILHAGDTVNPDILMAFDDVPVYRVRGNMDPSEKGLVHKRVVPVDRFRVGLIHGWGAPQGLEERVLQEFSGQQLDVLVYGHSHYPVCHRRDGVLFFNPGSPTDRRSAPFHSVGLLEIGDTVRGRIINLDE